MSYILFVLKKQNKAIIIHFDLLMLYTHKQPIVQNLRIAALQSTRVTSLIAYAAIYGQPTKCNAGNMPSRVDQLTNWFVQQIVSNMQNPSCRTDKH